MASEQLIKVIEQIQQEILILKNKITMLENRSQNKRNFENRINQKYGRVQI